jgi:hypothetical protein
MKKISKNFISNFNYVFLFIFVVVLLNPNCAYAYLDAGTGSYIIQIALAFLTGGIFLIKTFWIKIINFIKTKFKKSNEK